MYRIVAMQSFGCRIIHNKVYFISSAVFKQIRTIGQKLDRSSESLFFWFAVYSELQCSVS